MVNKEYNNLSSHQVISALIVLLLSAQFSYGQKKEMKKDRYEPFSLLIIQPDSATIADTLQIWARAIEKKYVDQYYSAVKGLELFKAAADEEAQSELNTRLEALKSREMDVLDFKYLHAIGYATFYELNILFNSDYWEHATPQGKVFDGSVVDRGELFTYDFQKLAKYYEVDYIITFENIRSDRRDGMGTIKYTATLFWAKANRVILKKEIEGNAPVENYKLLSDIEPPGNPHETGVDCENYLECMFTSAVRFSTEEFFKVLSRNQKK